MYDTYIRDNKKAKIFHPLFSYFAINITQQFFLLSTLIKMNDIARLLLLSFFINSITLLGNLNCRPVLCQELSSKSVEKKCFCDRIKSYEFEMH